MSLKSKFLVTFLIIATVLSGTYFTIASLYAPIFFHDTFHLTTYVERNPSADLGKKDIFFDSYLYRKEKRNSPAETAQIPDDEEELQKLLNEGWRIVHWFKGTILPLWIQKDGIPMTPERYQPSGLYFKKTQKISTLSRTGGGGRQYWGLIIPDCDCALAFIIISPGLKKILLYQTGILRNDMWKVRQKDSEENRTYTRINIPPMETLNPANEAILDFIENDNYLMKRLLDIYLY